MQGQGQVCHHGHQAPGEAQPAGPGGRGFVQTRPLARLELLPGRQNGIQAAELLQELGGAFFPDAGHALHVVAGIPQQGEEVHHLLGPYAHAGLHAFAVIPDLALLGVEHGDAGVVVHQLQQILVGAHDDGLEALGRGLPGQGGHHVIRLVALQLHDGDGEGRHQVADQGDLRPQILGHLSAVGLVLRVELVAEGGPRHIEHASHMAGLVLVQQLEHQPRERERRPVLQPGIGEVGTKDEGEGIDEIKAVLSHGEPLHRTARSRASQRMAPRK